MHKGPAKHKSKMLTSLNRLICVIIIATITYCWLTSFRKPLVGIRKRSPAELAQKRYGDKYPPKPQWVIKEIVRLKALYPTYSGYKLSFVFNRLYSAPKEMTVGLGFSATA
jgi:hypothetical protein